MIQTLPLFIPIIRDNLFDSEGVVQVERIEQPKHILEFQPLDFSEYSDSSSDADLNQIAVEISLEPRFVLADNILVFVLSDVVLQVPLVEQQRRVFVGN